MENLSAGQAKLLSVRKRNRDLCCALCSPAGTQLQMVTLYFPDLEFLLLTPVCVSLWFPYFLFSFFPKVLYCPNGVLLFNTGLLSATGWCSQGIFTPPSLGSFPWSLNLRLIADNWILNLILFYFPFSLGNMDFDYFIPFSIRVFFILVL